MMEHKMKEDEEIWKRENEKFFLIINMINCMSFWIITIINCLKKWKIKRRLKHIMNYYVFFNN